MATGLDFRRVLFLSPQFHATSWPVPVFSSGQPPVQRCCPLVEVGVGQPSASASVVAVAGVVSVAAVAAAAVGAAFAAASAVAASVGAAPLAASVSVGAWGQIGQPDMQLAVLASSHQNWPAASRLLFPPPRAL